MKCRGINITDVSLIFEIMPVSDEHLKDDPHTNAGSQDIQKQAIVPEGMLTLRQSAIQKLISGVTTLKKLSA